MPAWSQQTIILLNIAGTDYVNAVDSLPKLMPHRHNIATVDAFIFRKKSAFGSDLTIAHATKCMHVSR